MTKEEFIEKAHKVHGDKYDYSKVEYVNMDTKVCIICPKHGEFWQKAEDHVNGHGYYMCKHSSLEDEIYKFLIENKIKFIFNKRYKFLSNLQLDFYLPEYNAAIECQGIQHFVATSFTNSTKYEKEKKLETQIARDNLKKELCEKHGIKLFYYGNLNIEYPYMVYENKEELLNNIVVC